MFGFFKRSKSTAKDKGYLDCLREIASTTYEEPSDRLVPFMAKMALGFGNPGFRFYKGELETDTSHIEASIFGYVLLDRIRSIGSSPLWKEELNFRYIDVCSWAAELSGHLSQDSFMKVLNNRLDLYFNQDPKTPAAGIARDIELLTGLIHTGRSSGSIDLHSTYREAITPNLDFFQDLDMKKGLMTFYADTAKAIETDVWPTLANLRE